MDKISKWITDNLHYEEKRSGVYDLYYLDKETGIKVARSHEGYNHFAQWYVKLNGKIKKSFEIKEKEQALYAGNFLFYENLTENLEKIKKGKNGNTE